MNNHFNRVMKLADFTANGIEKPFEELEAIEAMEREEEQLAEHLESVSDKDNHYE